MKKFFGRYGYPDLFFFPKNETPFIIFVVLAFVASMLVVPVPGVAMWLGFLFAAYAAIANDSIQTIGPFIASNQDKKWWVLWIFLAGIFVITVLYSWLTLDGDVSHGRLASKGFETAPTSFHFLQIAAPVFLLILTRLRMPVSTTFILLTSFAASEDAVGKVLAKSFSGYILAFFIGLIAFLLLAKVTKKYFVGKPKAWWTVAQWTASGTLWSVWFMQDAANIAVYLPRSLGVWSFVAFTGIIVIGLGFLLYFRGGRIQEIVTEKSEVTDVRFATIITLIYCILLFYFKIHSKVPMSTTWVFLGLLGGRELGMAIMRTARNNKGGAARMIIKDFGYAMFGLLISIAIAVGVNDNISFTTMINDVPEQFVAGIRKFFTQLLGG